MSCNPTVGAQSSGSFTSNGVAAGTYPETYTESGTFTVQAQPRGASPGPPATAFESTFTIVSGANRITGTKRLRLDGDGDGDGDDDDDEDGDDSGDG